MANTNAKDRDAVRQENIEKTVSSTEQFFNEHKKLIWGVVTAVVVVFLGALAWNKFVYQRQCREAQEQAFPAEASFRNGEYEIALNGDGNNLGFADIISDYGAKAGKAVYLYAGICELQLGDYEGALAYLKKYKGGEPILASRAKACQGDAYVGLGKYQEAVGCFKAAVTGADNVFAAGYLLKEGLCWEALGDKAEALKCYSSIKENYPQSIESYEINKYIARVSE